MPNNDKLWGSISSQLDEGKGEKRAAWWWFFGGLAATITALVLLWPSFESDHLIEQKDLTCTENKNLTIPQGEVIKTPEALVIETDFITKSDLNTSDLDQRQTTFNLPNVRTDLDSLVMVNIPVIPWLLKGDVALMQIPGIDKLEVDLEKRKVPTCGGFTSPKHKNRIWEFGFDVAYWDDITAPNKAYELPDANVITSNQADNSSVDQVIDGSLESYSSTFNVSQGVLKYGSSNRRLNLNFNAGRYISHRAMLHTGIGFQRSSYYGYYNEPDFIDVKTSLSALSVPLKFSFDVMNKYQFKWRLNAGIHNEFALLEKAAVNYSNGGYGSTRNFTAGYFGALQAETEFQFRLRTGLFLTLKPSYRYYFKH
jgi:hypothetical protein